MPTVNQLIRKPRRTKTKRIKTTALRLETQLQPDCSAGILEWQIE